MKIGNTEIDKNWFRDLITIVFIATACILSYTLGKYTLIEEMKMMQDIICNNPNVIITDKGLVINKTEILTEKLINFTIPNFSYSK